MKIAIQGEPGSFSHEAAMKLVADAVIVPFSLSADAFAALAAGGGRRRHSHREQPGRLGLWSTSTCCSPTM
jgi:hypothetical protein